MAFENEMSRPGEIAYTKVTSFSFAELIRWDKFSEEEKKKMNIIISIFLFLHRQMQKYREEAMDYDIYCCATFLAKMSLKVIE